MHIVEDDTKDTMSEDDYSDPPPVTLEEYLYRLQWNSLRILYKLKRSAGERAETDRPGVTKYLRTLCEKQRITLEELKAFCTANQCDKMLRQSWYTETDA